MHDSRHSYIIAIYTRFVILLMRTKCVGPARVNKKAYYAY